MTLRTDKDMEMVTKATLNQHSRFKIGWAILLIFVTLLTLNHFALIFIQDEPILFTGYAAFNLYALIVILIPFRQGEKWAWFSTWILPLCLAVPAAMDPAIAVYYFVTSAFFVVGLLLTMHEFFSERT